MLKSVQVHSERQSQAGSMLAALESGKIRRSAKQETACRAPDIIIPSGILNTLPKIKLTVLRPVYYVWHADAIFHYKHICGTGARSTLCKTYFSPSLFPQRACLHLVVILSLPYPWREVTFIIQSVH